MLNAAPAGTVDPTLDIDDVFELLVGAIIYKIYSISFGMRLDTTDRTVDLVLRTICV